MVRAYYVYLLTNANSTEMDALTPNPVIAMMEEQKNITQKVLPRSTMCTSWFILKPFLTLTLL